mgnify:CR=1 FL=1
MVRVKFQRDFIVDESGTASRTVLVGYTVSGHAGCGDHGKDVVCAGVSAIAQAVVLALQEILGPRVRTARSDGFLSVDVDKVDASQEGTQALMRCLELGFQSISRQYPESVSLAYQDR